MNRRQFLFNAAILGATWPLGTTAAETRLRVGYFDRYWPFSQRGDDGAMTGLLIESLDAIAHSANLLLEHAGYPWARTQAMVERGELDAFCTVPTQGRSEYAIFCKSPVIGVFPPKFGT